MRFAEFLNQTESHPPEQFAEPGIIPRPDDESVIKAIKRLSDSYPMLDKNKLFRQTSSLMTQHVMQGRDQKEVIDELEALFKNQYEDYLKE